MPPLLRRILLAVAIALGVVALVVLGGSAWLMETTAGTRLVLSWASGSMPAGMLTVRELRGTLASPLELRGVTWRSQSLSISAERVSVHWNLTGLLRRELAVSLLEADTVRVRRLASSAPDTAATLALPDVRLPIGLSAREVHVRGFRYVPYGDTGSFALDEVSLSGDFHGERVRVASLTAGSRAFDLEAHGEIRPRREYPLDLELGMTLRMPGRPEVRGRAHVAGALERNHVTLRLEAPCAANAEAELSDLLGDPRVDGSVEFSGLEPRAFAAAVPPMRLAGRIAARGTLRRFVARGRLSMRSDSLGAADANVAITLGGDSLRVDTLLVSVPGRHERVSVRGLLCGLGGELRADLVADWRGAVWPLQGDTLLRSDQGRVHAAGTPAGYALRVDGALGTSREPLGRWQLEATGDTSHLDVASLEGRLSGGAVFASGTVAWKPRLEWRATVRADSLDPGRRWPEWPGRLALGFETEGTVRDKALEFGARITRLEGTLKQLPVAGQGAITGSGGSLGARELRLSWGDARLTADGASGESWDLGASFAAPTLTPFLEGASGALRAEVRLSGPRSEPHLKLEARGDSLELAKFEVGELTAGVDAGLRAGDPLRIDLDARRAVLGGRPVESLVLRGEGNTNRHTLTARVHAGADTLALAAGGGLERQGWRGRLDQFELRTRAAGAWQLEAPFGISVSAREARLDSFVVRSGSSNVRGAADWSPGRELRANLTLVALPLGLLNPFLPAGAQLVGTLDGSVTAHAERAEGPLIARARLTQSPAQVIYSIAPAQLDTIHVGEGVLSVDCDAAGARGELAVEWESGDRLEAKVALPGFNALRPDTLNQPLEGSLRSHAADLSVLGAYVPGLDHTRGNLSADLTLGGTLARPDVDGEIRLRDGTASIPALGVTIREATLVVLCEPGHRITLEGGASSGKGSVKLTGSADLASLGRPTVTVGVKGTNFSVADTREAKVLVSPELEVKLDPARVEVTGQLEVPFARLVTLEKMAQLPVPPSSDVVYVGREQDSTRAGPQVYSKVRIVIGDDVEVRVPGFRGRPEGSILATDAPGHPTLATGELTVEEGTYRAYGQDLKIERGRLIFGGGPISNPGLDLRATRTATDGTVAGFQILGTAEKPVLTLFSIPSMSETDALSYIMFGKPASETGGSSGAAGLAAAGLSVQGTDMLARGMAGKIGIQDASVESKEGSLQEASLFLGTYLSPQLYVSYGIGLFESSTTVRVRYKMNKHWSLQTESGTAPSGLLQYSSER